jgi:succinoglycan biosynthesis transport protein ExoP
MAEVVQTYGGRDQGPSLAQDLHVLSRAFISRWKLILVVIAACLFVGVAYVWTTPPSYTSSAEIFVDPRSRDAAGLNISPSGLGNSSQGADSGLVESQLQLLSSRSVLTKLIEQLDLTIDPEFASTQGQGLGAMVRNLLRLAIYGPNSDDGADIAPQDRAMEKLGRAIKVERIGQTYVLNIAVTTGSRQRSAEIANALAEIYVAETQITADGNALETAESLEARLAELQATSEASLQAVEDYRRANGLVGARGVLGDEQQLASMNDRLTDAVVATQNARAALDAARDAGTAPTSILSSDSVEQLRIQIAQSRSDESVLAGTFGDRHPRLVQARENRIALEQALQAEMQRIVARAQSDYDRAQETEASVRALVLQYEQQQANADQASVRLRELEQLAEQDRQLYESFATRAKQAREQIALPSSTARIISSAVPAIQPSGPKALLALAGSGLAGVILGFGLAWLLYIMRGEPAHAPALDQPKRRPVVTPKAPPASPPPPRIKEVAVSQIINASPGTSRRYQTASTTQTTPSRRFARLDKQ